MKNFFSDLWTLLRRKPKPTAPYEPEKKYLDVPAGGWMSKRLREYLSEKGMQGLPLDPREIGDYGQWLGAKGYKPNATSAALATVRKIYREQLIHAGDVLRSPHREPNRLIDPLPRQDVERVLSFAKAKCPDRDAVIVFLMSLGLQDTQISRLNVSDFYGENGKYWLRAGKSRVRVEDEALALLVTYLKTIGARGPNAAMFQGQRGRTDPATVSRIVSLIMQACGVKDEGNKHRG